MSRCVYVCGGSTVTSYTGPLTVKKIASQLLDEIWAGGLGTRLERL